MSINYESIKNSLTPEQRAILEGKKKEPKPRPTIIPIQQVTGGTSEPSMGWVNCEQGCMGRNNGPEECDVCGGKMIPGPSSGFTPRQLKKK